MDKTRELLRLTKEGNEAAREQIILNNVGLIWSVVRRFTNRGYESEDLFQIGSAGRFLCRTSRLIQGGQQHRGENRDDRNNDQKFDQGEIPFHGTVSVGLVEHLFKLYRRTAAMSITRNLFPESFMTES